MMKNLFKETVDFLHANNRYQAEVFWVGSKDGRHSTDWRGFMEMAQKLDYDEDLGQTYVAKDLVVVGQGWWLERHNYDGAECWHYKTVPTMMIDGHSLDTIDGRYGEGLIADAMEGYDLD